MNNEYEKETLKARIEHHRKMAESYHMAYVARTVEGGETYKERKFTFHAKYGSSYPNWDPMDFLI